MYERFKKLCDSKGVKASNVLKELGIANSVVANWRARNSLPNGQTAIKIADYFGITTDEVLGRKTSDVDKIVELSDEERAIIECFRNSDKSEKEHLLKYIEFLSEENKTPPEGN